jgi:hypothetical protein
LISLQRLRLELQLETSWHHVINLRLRNSVRTSKRIASLVCSICREHSSFNPINISTSPLGKSIIEGQAQQEHKTIVYTTGYSLLHHLSASHSTPTRCAATSPSNSPPLHSDDSSALPSGAGNIYRIRSSATITRLMIFPFTTLGFHVQEKKTTCPTIFNSAQDVSDSPLTSIPGSHTSSGFQIYLPAASSTTLDGRWSIPVPPAGGRTILLSTKPTQRSEKPQPCWFSSGREETLQ